MQVILLTTISLTILTGLLIAFDVDDWIYAKTIGVITLSAHPLYKPSKLKIKSTITLNSKGEQKEKIYVKVLFLFFWWKLHEVRYHDDYDLGGYNTNELRTFKSIDEAKEFLEQYMKPVEKVYNLA